MHNITFSRWQRVKELFAAAAHMTPPERSSFLARACHGDGEVRGEVERLLQQQEQMGDFLESKTDRDWFTLAFDLHTFTPGDLVTGRFRIVRFIGRGGMGEVYEADDEELGRKIALKTIRPEIAADDRVVARFMQEIQLSLKVTHPNVCRVYDIGHDKCLSKGIKNEVTYLTMELLPGQNLAERLQASQRMTTHEALPIVRQIISGLQAAHEAGIVHGDLKSSNVVLVPTDDGGCRAVVTDFGLARLVAVAASEIARPVGGTGTPAYMAPEQVTCGTVTPAADIYSLGVIMFEMVTGTLPFMADTPTMMAYKRLEKNAPPPRSIVSDLDRKWDYAIIKCLERDPQNRFCKPIEVGQGLQRAEWLHLPSSLWRFVLGAAACGLLLPISFGGYRAWRTSTPKYKVALAQTRIKEGQERQYAGDFKRAEVALEEARALYKSARNLPGVAEALTKEGDLFTDKRDFVRASASYQSALAIARDADDQQRTGIVLLNLGFMFGKQGDVVGKRRSYESALEIFKKIGDKRHIATVLKNLGNTESGADSQRHYEEALTMFKDIGYKPGAASTLDDLGGVLNADGYLAGARKAFEEELSMWNEVTDKAFTGASALTKFNLGCVLYEQGHLSEGRQQLEGSLRLTRELDGSVAPESLDELAELLLQEGDVTEARKAAEEALALAYKSGNHGQIGGARLTIARVAMEEEHPAEAESQAKQALEQFGLQNESWNQVQTYAVLSLAFVGQRRFRDARNTIRTMVVPAMKDRSIYDERLYLMIAVGKVFSTTGSLPQGFKYLESALEDSKRLGYLGHELEARMALGEIKMKSGQTEQGRARLAAVEKGARANGFGLIARKAERAMEVVGP
jgi:tetratricopeptide (TPR) repeat protein